MTFRIQSRRLLVAVGLATCAALALAPASAWASGSRFAGANRYGTAVALFGGQRGCYGAVGFNLVVASGEDYHDALAANFIAGQGGVGGMLLTQNAQLSTETHDALVYTRCDGKPTEGSVYVVDGAAQIADATVASIKQAVTFTNGAAPVQRVHGADAYATAAAVATASGMTVGSTQKYGRVAIVASGVNFPDALAASPLVYAQHFPLLFTQPDSVPQVTTQALQQLGIQTVLLLGGTAAVSSNVEAQLKQSYQVVRVAGGNRQLTATALASMELADFSFGNNLVHLVRGDAYPDALAGGQRAGGGGAYQPILLSVSPTVLGHSTSDYLQQNSGQIRGNVDVFGGTSAVSDSVWQEAQQAAGG